MKRHELEHILRAASGNTARDRFFVFGSQSILGKYPNAPDGLLLSQEADVSVVDANEQEDMAALIDGTIGEISPFHQTFGYYAHGVTEETVLLPDDWKSRVISIVNENTRGASGGCLHPDDLAVSKLIAGREKDVEYLEELFRHQLVEPAKVSELLPRVPRLTGEQRALAQQRLLRICKRLDPSSGGAAPLPGPPVLPESGDEGTDKPLVRTGFQAPQ